MSVEAPVDVDGVAGSGATALEVDSTTNLDASLIAAAPGQKSTKHFACKHFLNFGLSEWATEMIKPSPTVV